MSDYDTLEFALPRNGLPAPDGERTTAVDVETAESPVTRFPWSGRTPDEWLQAGVTAAEAARLLALAQVRQGSAHRETGLLLDVLDPRTLATYGLSALPTIYNAQELRKHATGVDFDFYEEMEVCGGTDLPTLASKLCSLFAIAADMTHTTTDGEELEQPAHDPGAGSLFALMAMMRRLRTERLRENHHRALGVRATAAALPLPDDVRALSRFSLRTPVSTTRTPQLDPLPIAAAAELGWSKRQQDEATARYQALLALFFPQVRMYAKSDSSRSRSGYDPLAIDRAEDEQAIFEKLATAAVNFFWETAAIDPIWTTARFLYYAWTACRKSHAWARNDSHGLEVLEAAWRAGSDAAGAGGRKAEHEDFYSLGQNLGDETADQAVTRVVDGDLMAILHKLVTEYPLGGEAFLLSTFGDYTQEEIGQRQGGASDAAVGNRLRAFKRLLAARLAERYPDKFAARPEVRKGGQGAISPVWAELRNRRYTPAQLLILPPMHRTIIETALRVAQDVAPERNAILDAICAVHPQWQRSTVRRAVQGGIRILDHLPEEQRGENPASLKRRQWARLGAVFRHMQEHNPRDWHALPEQTRHLVELYYLADTQPTEVEVAEQLGCHSSTVHRNLNILARRYVRSYRDVRR
jgi:hypothetical protein